MSIGAVDLLNACPHESGELEEEQTTGSLRERQDLKYELRASFWRAIQEAAAALQRELRGGIEPEPVE